ncbi:PaaI family thioesterase [Altererythrobacter sp.]|uniref:PaaI family thioesterase n=1 Tax=Altererythrobacter sp. TaxID=1872480 RepID=UPI001B0AB1E1|nr:PaaI family thioesterase [Altererythrobacter sp.]MBO6610391.1 PaaI family thioesterase [Altererythrobacter sp.]MBO6642661.1 PaaI family thioesterase [Altererythrobacter sp.]MBO6708831.1 PaaI family thioesterase [Altererythrobacter sp.]
MNNEQCHPSDGADSPHSALLGSEFVGFDEETATATMRFTVRKQMTTWRGGVQGGLVAGYLDDVMGYAYVAMTGGEQAPLNLEISMQLLGLLPEGATIIGKGRVVRGGRRVIFLEGELQTDEGQVLARATSTAIPTIRPTPTETGMG